MNINHSIRAFFCLISLFYASISYAILGPNSRGVTYQYPVAGSHDVSPETGIGVRAFSAYDADGLSKGSYQAIGSVSGIHALTLRLSRDRMTAVFKPATPFVYGEVVIFSMMVPLAGGAVAADSFTFTTMRRAPPATIPDWVRNETLKQKDFSEAMSPLDSSANIFPSMTVSVDSGPTPGTIYMANEGFVLVPNQFYLFTLDEHGKVTKQKSLGNDYAQDFKLQPSGLRTYFSETQGVFYGLDSAWNIIDTFATQNCVTDSHELRFLPDGSYALIGYSETYQDMSSYVTGGYDSAEIYGGVIQIFDPDGLLVFEWRGIDNFEVQDATFQNLTASGIDFEHANSLDFDSSGNIILSSRHLCEITKINRDSGDIMWRFGGHHNQFQLLGDSIWFSYQHAVRLLPNGHLIFMDNSNFDTLIGGDGSFINESRAVEYELDTKAMTARLVWQFHHSPETYTDAMGYVERLPNGNTFIGWGSDTVAVTELRPDNSTAFEMNMWNGNVSYRAIKFLPDTSHLSVPVAAGQTGLPTLSIANDPATGMPQAVVTLSEPSNASLELYDVLGREAAMLASGMLNSGSHVFPVNARGLATGAYYCVLRAGDGGQVVAKPVEIIR